MSNGPGQARTAERIADQLAISEIHATHSRGLDRHEPAAIKSCYWEDAQVDYGAFKGPAHTFADLVVPALQDQYELTRHALSNTLFHFEGDSATTETYVHAAHLAPDASEETLVYGRYLDRLEKRDGQWKMAFRQVVIEWSNRYSVSDERDGPAFKDLTRGGHHPSDPVYLLLDNA